MLATVDDAPARHVLEQQQGQLASQQAALTRLVNATTVTGAQNTTNQAGEILDATQDQATRRSTPTSRRWTARRSSSTSTRTRATTSRTSWTRPRSACAASGGSPSSASVDTSGLLSAILGQSDSDGDGDDDSAEERKKRLEAALKAAGSLAGSLVSSAASAANSACTQVATLQSAPDPGRAAGGGRARRRWTPRRTGCDVDEAAGRVQVENARQGVVTAQNNLDSARRTGRR